MKKFLLIVGFIFIGIFGFSQQWYELSGKNKTTQLGDAAASSPIIAIDSSNNIYAARSSSSGNFSTVLKFSGSIWDTLKGVKKLPTVGAIRTIHCDKFGYIYVAGSIVDSSGYRCVQKWDGTNWNKLGNLNANFDINKIISDKNGNIYVSGKFTGSGGGAYVAKWDGNQWTELGGLNGLSYFTTPFVQEVLSMCIDKNNNIFVGTRDLSGSNNIVRKYNGVSWVTYISSLYISDFVYDMITDSKANLYVAELHSIKKWNGTNFIAIPFPRITQSLWKKFFCDRNDNLYVSYPSTTNSNYIEKYNGKKISKIYYPTGPNSESVSDFLDDSWGNFYLAGIDNLLGKNMILVGYQVAKKDLPTMQGYIFTDHNSNSIKDTLESYKSNVKVQLSNGNYTFTDNNGFYQIQADSIGVYTLTVTAPNLYNAVPQIINYNFTSWDTVVTRYIALQPTIVKDSVAINVIPMLMNALQGGAMPYDVQYDNTGTTLLSPNVALTYNNYLLTYDSCTNATAQPIPNGIIAGEPNMQPGKHSGFISFFTIKPSSNIGDTLRTVYSITTPTVSQTDSFYMIIEGGVAKADAQRATPSLTDAQVAAGKDIVYTIGYKNTGTDTAYNIVITDTLSGLLKANTLQMIASSHTCKTTVKGNLVTFELLNIKLPKSSTNAAKSIGYVSFKIKPQSNLTAGTIIINKANAYYNYRAPQSSTATTIIKAVVTPLKMMNYELRMMNDKQVENTWTTANEFNVSHFNIQRSINNKNFINIGKVTANNNALNEYRYTDYGQLSTVDGKLYYRIESVDNDGRKQYSEIRNVALGIRNGGISIYPNPAKDVITLECKGAKELMVIDYLGKIVYREIASGTILRNDIGVVKISGFAKGLYLVKIITKNNEIKNEKLIIQ